jgi:hypothetical protein
MPRQPIGQNRSGRIGAGRIIARNARMLVLMLKIVLMMGGGIGLAGCTSALHDDELQMGFDDYCAQRATDGVTVLLCGQDESDRMMVLYAVEQRCRDAEPPFFTDCQYLEAEFRRLILRDIDRLIDRSSLFMIP